MYSSLAYTWLSAFVDTGCCLPPRPLPSHTHLLTPHRQGCKALEECLEQLNSKQLRTLRDEVGHSTRAGARQGSTAGMLASPQMLVQGRF